MKTTPKLTSTAYHEAGHAVASVVLGVGFRYVTIKPNKKKNYLGKIQLSHKGYYVSDALNNRNRLRMEKIVIVWGSGLAAERRVGDELEAHIGSHDDFADCRKYVEGFVFSESEVSPYCVFLSARTEGLIDTFWPEVEAVAKALLERETLKKRDVIEMLGVRD